MSDTKIDANSAKSNKLPLTLLDWRPLRRNSLLGFAKVRIGRALVLHDVSVHVSNGKRWASPASKPQMDSNGQALRDDRQKIKYTPVVEWLDAAARDAFSIAVIEAVEAGHPGATDAS